MEKIMLLGGFGFVGKNIIEYLYTKYLITVLDKNQDLVFINKYPNIKFAMFDFLNDKNLSEIIQKEQPNYIVNLVSIVITDREIKLLEEMIKLNLKVLLDLFEASNNLSTLKLVLHVGSGEEYGNILAPMKETDREYPNSPYALSKQLTTNTAIMLNKNFNFPIAVVRPCNLYGKYQSSEKFFPYLIDRLLKNQEIITTPGQQKRDFMYVRDFIEVIDSIFSGYKNFIGEIFNVSSGNSETIQEIILECKDYIKSESVVIFGKMPYKQDEIMHFELDNTKLFQRTGKPFICDNQKSRQEFIDSFLEISH